MELTNEKTSFETAQNSNLNYDSNIRTYNSNEEGDNNSSFPVFRISQDGRIVYANRAAFPLLKEWNCYASNTIPAAIRELHPVLTNLEADETIDMVSDTFKFHLSVVGFRTAGYIGVYGFKTEMIANTNVHHNN